MPRSTIDAQGSSALQVVDLAPRAAKTLRRGERSGLFPAASEPRAAQAGGTSEPPRSAESLRAEMSRGQLELLPREQRPLAKARDEFAEAFDRVMNAHWLRGEEAYSNVAIARACGVDEKTVRAWRSEGRTEQKPMPAAALRLLPSQVFGEMLDYLSTARGRTPKRALVKLREALGELDGQIAHEDAAEVLRALLGAQEQIAGLMKKAMGGGAL